MIGSRRLIPSTSMMLAFEAASRTGSFTAAGKELHLTQGAVSRQVGALEKQLGIDLFVRHGKTISLSVGGEIYAAEIAAALQTIRNASLNLISDPKGGIVNLAVLPTFGTRWLMPRFPAFLEENPQITVNFATKLSPFDFRNENLHAAIHYGKPDWPDVDATYLMSEDVFVVGAPFYKEKVDNAALNSIANLPLLHLETRPLAWSNWFQQNGIDVHQNTGASFEQFAILIQAAIAGIGIALLPLFLIEKELARGELTPLIDSPLKSEEGYYLVTPKNQPAYSPVNALRSWILGQAKL